MTADNATDSTDTRTEPLPDYRAGTYPARSNDHLKTTGIGGIAYKGKTLVYSPDHSPRFHADKNCPVLSSVEVVRKLPLDHVLTNEGLPNTPCSRCTCDMATSIRVATTYDGADQEAIVYE